MTILRRLLVLVLAVVIVAGIVIATLPAQYAYRLLADRLGPVALSGISGSIWQGRATSLVVFGQDVGTLDWHLDFAPLLQAELRARVKLDGGAVQASAIVTCTGNGDVDLRNVVFHMPASLAAPVLDIPALTLLGDIDGQVAQARLQNAWINRAKGSVRWHDAAVAGAAQARLGDLQATFYSTPQGVIRGTARDMGGPLKLTGTFSVDAGQFEVDAVLAARDGNPQILDALNYIGQPQADGSSHLIVHGRLFRLFQ